MALRAPVRLYQDRGHVLTSAPSVEPVTADELREKLRETSSQLGDTEANELIATAREYAEKQTGLALITQSWRMAIDRWPSAREPWWDGVRDGSITELYGPQSASDLHFPRYPLQSVDNVTVYDEDTNSPAVTIANVFDVDTYSEPGRMTLKRGATWPVALRANNAIEIVYTAGYGDAATDVPAPLKRAVKTTAAYMYANRGDGCGCDVAAIESGAQAILNGYKVARL